jgi:threonine dehydrogenase-like Zn-dependent dehydrogenase
MRVLVIGPGTIGQGIALMARRAGAAVTAIAGLDDSPRLETARALGFECLFDLATPDGHEQLVELADAGFDVVFEAAGTPEAVAAGLELLRSGGVFVCAGIHDALAPIDMTRLVRHQFDIRGSYRAPISAWKQVIEALAEEPSTFAPMITRQMQLDEGLEAFALAHGRAESKILLIP